jgi:hypothetical protein
MSWLQVHTKFFEALQSAKEEWQQGEQALKDQARYRWLKANAIPLPGAITPEICWSMALSAPEGMALDDAIDAAIAQEIPPGTPECPPTIPPNTTPDRPERENDAARLSQ